MKIYLASRFALKTRVQAVHDAVVAAGHEVPDVWWNYDAKSIDLPDDHWYGHNEVKAIADRHWKNIRECDALVLVCDSLEPGRFNGANVELGYALGHGKFCFSVGNLERSAMYVPVTRAATVPRLLELLEARQQVSL